MKTTTSLIDPVYALVDPISSPLCRDVWEDKYQYKGETYEGMMDRVADAIYAKDTSKKGQGSREHIRKLMKANLWMPAGRILAGAGTEKRVTLLNCFVNGTLEDDMESITVGLANIMLTQQQGGGIGTDFSPLRPPLARLHRTGASASGPGPFMDTWDSACTTIRSTGDRRGAMMGTLICTHPFLPEFIRAKHEPGKWTNFNVSVLVTDAFMSAVQEDEEWTLHHPAMPNFERPAALVQQDFRDDDDVHQYAYSVHRARDLWDQMMRSTYEYAEPGVIFIDRVNDMNNLAYVEEIMCTNPCVTGDTLILTKQGHQPIKELVGVPTEIWNGFEWSVVTPFTTGINNLMEVSFSNGHTVRCTPYHKWVLHDGTRVAAEDLKVTDKLLHVEMPLIDWGHTYPIDAYSQGFYSGDGTKNAESSNLYKHGEGIRERLVGKFYDRNCTKQPGHRWVHGEMLPKDFVPINGTPEYCLNWLAGLLDADGCTVKKPATSTLEISAKDRDFLQRTGLMLNRLGINYRMWEGKDGGLKKGSNGKEYMCEPTARLMISWSGAHHLVQLGLKCARINLEPFQQAPKGVSKVGHRVIGIKHTEVQEETFCFTETSRNMGVFNGIIGSNCGEQPLPPHGCCDLGAANISRMVRNPFTEDAEFDWELLKLTVREGVRFLDNVIDVTNYPLEAQRDEEFNKRRIGLGISGLADAMHFLGMRYGSVKSLKFTEQVMRTICIEAYWASVELAKEKGPFPLFDTAKYCARPFIESLPEDLQAAIREHGIRNGVLLTIAPTGTTSIAYGNGSSGLEPVFAHSMKRKVRQADGTFLPYEEVAFGARLYLAMNPDATLDDLPSYMNVCNDVKVHEHIRIQEVCQRWVDASISKTINLPKEISYEDFKDVYQQAYDADCKGCTTYRPSDVRGSILEVSSDTSSAAEQTITASKLELVEVARPDTIQSRTTKIRWNGLSSALYLTIGYVNGKPFEVFLNSKDQKAMEWTMGLTLLMSMCLRKNIPLATIADEFQKISSLEGSWAVDVTTGKGRYWPSLIAYLGHRMEHLADPEAQDAPEQEALEGGQADQVAQTSGAGTGSRCNSCGQMEVHKLSGCDTCANCGWSKCG